MFEGAFWVSEVIVASMAGGVVSVDNCWSSAGCTGFKSCSISVEVIGVSLGVTSDSGRGGGGGGMVGGNPGARGQLVYTNYRLP